MYQHQHVSLILESAFAEITFMFEPASAAAAAAASAFRLCHCDVTFEYMMCERFHHVDFHVGFYFKCVCECSQSFCHDIHAFVDRRCVVCIA